MGHDDQAMTTVAELRAEALARIATLPEGAELDPFAEALIRLGLAASVTALDPAAFEIAVAAAFDAGATVAQVHEIVVLVSGLGVHSLMLTSAPLVEAAARHGLIDPGEPLDPERQALWARHVGDDPFWAAFSAELPGFLEALLRLSPHTFAAFFAYCALPWQSGQIRGWIKELVALACDVSSTHCFAPGFRVHLANAIALGTGRRAIAAALSLAEAAPRHPGISA